MYIAFVVIVLFFTIATKGLFVSSRNIGNLVNATSYIAILAVGMTLVIVIRHIDLSVGYLAGTLGAVAAISMKYWGLSVWSDHSVGIGARDACGIDYRVPDRANENPGLCGDAWWLAFLQGAAATRHTKHGNDHHRERYLQCFGKWFYSRPTGLWIFTRSPQGHAPSRITGDHSVYYKRYPQPRKDPGVQLCSNTNEPVHLEAGIHFDRDWRASPGYLRDTRASPGRL